MAITGRHRRRGCGRRLRPTVLSVGGTTLSVTAAAPMAAKQPGPAAAAAKACTKAKPAPSSPLRRSGHRDMPDVAYDANPGTGFAVYDSMPERRHHRLDGGRRHQRRRSAMGRSDRHCRSRSGTVGPECDLQRPAAIFALPAADFHDVTTGAAANAAGTGYDLATGRGTPIANLLVADLVGKCRSPRRQLAIPRCR